VFRIFLKKKIESGEMSQTGNAEAAKGQDRRVHERFSVDQQHLTVMNDQDILQIRDISVKGFCSDVSDRAFERFTINDVFEARMRCHGEIQAITIRVMWKRGKAVGFELHEPSREALIFFRDLVRPYQLAQTMRLIEAQFLHDQDKGRLWYHGEDIDLHIWSSEEGALNAWQLVADDQLIEWSSTDGIRTGIIAYKGGKTIFGVDEDGESHHVLDPKVEVKRVRFAADVFAASNVDELQDLEKTLDELESTSSAS
jgi:hypothetical protein